MIVSYHDYRLNNEFFISGANCYYIENSKLLKEQKPQGVKLAPHDFRNLILGKEKLPKLTEKDTLLSNVGPYAHMYFYLREKYNLKFRIIRDVQTGLWPGYLLQEKICSNYMREGDKTMFLSEFSRQLYIKLFPEALNEGNTFVCAPFMYFFPKRIEMEKKEKKDDDLVLGWVGRVAWEKNFDQALDTFIRLYKERGNVKFIVAGESSNKIKLGIKKKLEKNKIKTNAFTYVNEGHFIPHKNVWDIYKKMDVFLFPSLSINESLGRTMIEACYIGIPVIAACYGAAPEILNEKNLVPVRYRDDLIQLDGGERYSFGKVDIDKFIKKLYNYKKLSQENNIAHYINHYKKFFNILQNTEHQEKLKKLNKSVKNFIDSTYLHRDHTKLNIKQIMNRTKWFINGKMNNEKINNRIDTQKENRYGTKLTYNKENYYILNQYHFFLPAFLNYSPHVSLSKENPKIKFQKFLIHLKKPFKKPVKVAFYFYLKHKSLAKYPASFNLK